MNFEDFKFRTGDWIFVNGKEWVSKAIRAVTFSKVSHVGIMESEEVVFETDIKWGRAKLNPVVKYKDKSVLVYRPDYEAAQLAKIPALCAERKDRLYSALDIITNFVFAPLHPAIRGKIVSCVGNKRFQICSEQVCDITYCATGWEGLEDFESFTPDDALRYAQANFKRVF